MYVLLSYIFDIFHWIGYLLTGRLKHCFIPQIRWIHEDSLSTTTVISLRLANARSHWPNNRTTIQLGLWHHWHGSEVTPSALQPSTRICSHFHSADLLTIASHLQVEPSPLVFKDVRFVSFFHVSPTHNGIGTFLKSSLLSRILIKETSFLIDSHNIIRFVRTEKLQPQDRIK